MKTNKPDKENRDQIQFGQYYNQRSQSRPKMITNNFVAQEITAWDNSGLFREIINTCTVLKKSKEDIVFTENSDKKQKRMKSTEKEGLIGQQNIELLKRQAEFLDQQIIIDEKAIKQRFPTQIDLVKQERHSTQDCFRQEYAKPKNIQLQVNYQHLEKRSRLFSHQQRKREKINWEKQKNGTIYEFLPSRYKKDKSTQMITNPRIGVIYTKIHPSVNVSQNVWDQGENEPIHHLKNNFPFGYKPSINKKNKPQKKSIHSPLEQLFTKKYNQVLKGKKMVNNLKPTILDGMLKRKYPQVF